MSLPEPYYATPDGKVTLFAGHVLDVLREMPAESVNCVVTSPPYWSLRKYDCESVVWGGSSECEHGWGDIVMGGESYTSPIRFAHGHNGPKTRATHPDAWQKQTPQGQFCRLCGAWLGQYGLEPTPELYVEHTLMWMREVRRVLRKDGTLWLNIGDGYAGSGQGQVGEKPGPKQATNSGSIHGLSGTGYGNGLKPKDAVLMPFRVALAAQADGWWVRSVIIWHKPNPMPESVRDRPTDAHEYIFLLTKSARYFYDAEAVKEAGSPNTHRRAPVGQVSRPPSETPQGIAARGRLGVFTDGRQYDYEPGDSRNCRSVWTFPTQGFPDAHFAVFPRELPERCIKAGCPESVCPKCGKARVRLVEPAVPHGSASGKISAFAIGRDRDDLGRFTDLRTAPDLSGGPRYRDKYSNPTATLGWTDCGCGAGFVGGVVLDPFAGSGTTCEVAYHLGRTAWGIDASAKYLDMAIERVKQGALL